MSKPKSKSAKPASKSKPVEKSKPKPKPAAKPALPSMTPTTPIHGTVGVVPGTSASVVAPGTTGLAVNGREEKETLALTIRLPRTYRTRIDTIAEESGISVNALFQQLFDRYGTKVDLGPRLDAVEERLTRLEAIATLDSELASMIEALGKIGARPEGIEPQRQRAEVVPAVEPTEPETFVQPSLALLPTEIQEGFVDMYFARLPEAHDAGKLSVVLKYLDAERVEIEAEAFGATLEEAFANLLVELLKKE